MQAVVEGQIHFDQKCLEGDKEVPIESKDRLKSLLANGSIAGLTIDSIVFRSQDDAIPATTIDALLHLRSRSFLFCISRSTLKDAELRLEKMMTNIMRRAQEAVLDAVFVFDTSEPTGNELLAMISGGMRPADEAAACVGDFLARSGCEVVDHVSSMEAGKRSSRHHGQQGIRHVPGLKFSDALALHSIERTAELRGSGILVVSEEGPWQEFCKDSSLLFAIGNIDLALSLICDAPLELKRPLAHWLAAGNQGRAQVSAQIKSRVEDMEVKVSASVSSGEVEIRSCTAEVISIDWPSAVEMLITDVWQLANGRIRVLLCVPIELFLRVSSEVYWSVQSSVDSSLIGMGVRNIQVDEDREVRAYITADLILTTDRNHLAELVAVELQFQCLNVDIGEVPVFETEDYDE